MLRLCVQTFLYMFGNFAHRKTRGIQVDYYSSSRVGLNTRLFVSCKGGGLANVNTQPKSSLTVRLSVHH